MTSSSRGDRPGRQRHDRARRVGDARRAAGRDRARRRGHIADVVATGVEVVLTHGNGPQVGNLLVKNELAAHVVPPVPLDWCVAQTQATIGFTLADELDAALAARGPAAAHRRPGHPHAGRRRRPRLPRAVEAGRPLPPARGGGTVRRPRPDLGGPRREGLAPGRRLPRAEVRRRLPRDPRPGRRRLRRRLRRRRRHPGGGRRPGRHRPARRRGRHRQGPHRRDPGPRAGRRHPGHRHRRPAT